MIFKQGFWKVKNEIFTNKFLALEKASRYNESVTFEYNNEVWENFDRSQLGKIPLDTLYKHRALQLRDRYDYLILYYSGGSDSHNILKTFIDNDIHLDEVCVKWPKPLIDGKWYQINNIDTNPENFWSEWNYSIQPILKWLSENTKVKINLIDPINNILNKKTRLILDNIDHDRNPGAIVMNDAISDTVLSDNKLIGHLYGIDKPLLFLKNDQIHMFFTDFPFTTMSKNIYNVDSAECFYWAPDFPILTFEMAFQLANDYKNNPDNLKFLYWSDSTISSQIHNNLARKVCYSTWDFRFQADKPKNNLRNDKYKWVNTENELLEFRNTISSSIDERKTIISENFLKKGLLKTFHSKTFFVTDI